VAAARRDYGVAVDADGRIDAAATAVLRGQPRAPVDAFGPARARWEAVFDDATMNHMCAVLLALPMGQRHAARTALFETAVPGVSAQGVEAMAAPDFDPAVARDRLARAMDDLAARASAA
jgi:hypothetical protein